MSVINFPRFTAFAITLGFLLIAALTGCKKDNSVNNDQIPGNSSVVFKLTTINPLSSVNRLATAASVESTSIQWVEGNASVSQIKFEAKKSGNELEFKSMIGQTVDILTLASILGSVSIPPGNYKEVSFKLQLEAIGSKPSIELKGTIGTGTKLTNVVFSSTEKIELKRKKENVTIDNDSFHKAITSIDLSLITADISLSLLGNAMKTNGAILINAASNPELYKIMLKNISEQASEEDFD